MRRFHTALVLMSMLAAAVAVGAELPATDLWAQANAAADAAEYEEADRHLTSLMDRGRQTGIERYPLLAESAAGLAEQADAEGNEELAAWAMRAAATLDPRLPAVSFSAADIARRNQNWAGAAQSVLTGIGKIRRDYSTSLLARHDLALVLLLAIGLATAGIALMLLVRHGRAVAHDFREMLSGRFSAGITTVIAFALLFLPIFFWLGPTWLVLWWLALFFPYASWKERATIVVLLLLLAMIPFLIAYSASRVAGLQSPVVQAAIAGSEHSWDEDAALRLQALIEILPEEPLLHMLLGNLAVQHGQDQEALIHYRRAVQLDEGLAGAHLNIGNLHFFNNDFAAAISRYEQAGQLDSAMAAAPFNHSEASAQLNRYTEQRAQMEEARRRDRSLVDWMVDETRRRGIKVVMYEVPMSQAWALASRISRGGEARELYGNYSVFDPAASLMTPLTAGALGALILGVLLWLPRRNGGLAGACIKCGRTFCPRCKSARESATYCTQCIHIYLKRDGVALDTKRQKLEEVQDYQGRVTRTRKLLGTFLPGAPRVLSGSPFSGTIILVIFLLFVSLAVLVGRLAPLGPSPETMRLLVRSLAIFIAALLWLIFTIPVYREKPGQ